MSADFIAALVEAAPELTAEQRRRLAPLLSAPPAPTRRTDRTTRPASRTDKGRPA